MTNLAAQWLARRLVWPVLKYTVMSLAGAAVVLASCTTVVVLPGVSMVSGGVAVQPAPFQPVLPAIQLVPTLGPVAVPAVPAPAPSVDDPLPGRLISAAMTWLNPPVPYLWSGCSRRGVDCSCFVQLNLATVGISAPRNTVMQMAWTLPLRRDQLRPGALVYFNNTCTGCGANPTHVGLYVGDGMMIDAGDPVKLESIETAYWRSHYAAAGWPPGL